MYTPHLVWSKSCIFLYQSVSCPQTPSGQPEISHNALTKYSFITWQLSSFHGILFVCYFVYMYSHSISWSYRSVVNWDQFNCLQFFDVNIILLLSMLYNYFVPNGYCLFVFWIKIFVIITLVMQFIWSCVYVYL